MKNHPMQPVEYDGEGVIRFRKNAIVEKLLETSSLDLNQIACMKFSDADRMQFAQLIGYSVSGFSDLSYADRAVVRRADKKNEQLAEAHRLHYSDIEALKERELRMRPKRECDPF